MPVLFLAALMGGLATALGSIVGRVIIALGIGFTTYKGIDLAVSSVKNLVISNVQSIGGDALNLIGFLWLDRAMTLMFSAVVASMALKAINGSVKKALLK